MGTAAHRQFAGHDPVTVVIVTVSRKAIHV